MKQFARTIAVAFVLLSLALPIQAQRQGAYGMPGDPETTIVLEVGR